MKKIKANLLFLGSGGSTGVPMVGCGCAVCTSIDPHNQRLRPSVLLTIGEKKLLVDTGPDFRLQALSNNIKHLDGVLLTHTHFDHIAGLDELRTFYLLKRQILPLLVSQTTLNEIKKRYDYLFQKQSNTKSLAAQLDFHVLDGKRGHTRFLDIPIQYMTYRQGGTEVSGFRWGDIAYIPDIKEYDESIFDDLKDLRVLIVSALRYTPSPVHFSVDEAIAFATKVGAKQSYFMHIAHELDHAPTNASLPAGIALAFDGLSLDFEI